MSSPNLGQSTGQSTTPSPVLSHSKISSPSLSQKTPSPNLSQEIPSSQSSIPVSSNSYSTSPNRSRQHLLMASLREEEEDQLAELAERRSDARHVPSTDTASRKSSFASAHSHTSDEEFVYRPSSILKKTSIPSLTPSATSKTTSIQSVNTNKTTSIQSVNSNTASLQSAPSRDSHVVELVSETPALTLTKAKKAPSHIPIEKSNYTPPPAALLSPTSNFLAINSSKTSLHSIESVGSSYKSIDDEDETGSLSEMAAAADGDIKSPLTDAFIDRYPDTDEQQDFEKEDVIRIQKHLDKIRSQRMIEENSKLGDNLSDYTSDDPRDPSPIMKNFGRIPDPPVHASPGSINYDEAMSMDAPLKPSLKPLETSRRYIPVQQFSPDGASPGAEGDDEGAENSLMSPWTPESSTRPYSKTFPTSPDMSRQRNPPPKPPPPSQSLEQTLIASGQSDLAARVAAQKIATPPTPGSGSTLNQRSRGNSITSPVSSRPSPTVSSPTSTRKISTRRIRPSDISVPQLVSTSTTINAMPIVHLDEEAADGLGIDMEDGTPLRKSLSGKRLKSEFDDSPGNQPIGFKNLLKRFNSKKNDKGVALPRSGSAMSSMSSRGSSVRAPSKQSSMDNLRRGTEPWPADESMRRRYDPKLEPVTMPLPVDVRGQRRRSQSMGAVLQSSSADVFSDPETYGAQEQLMSTMPSPQSDAGAMPSNSLLGVSSKLEPQTTGDTFQTFQTFQSFETAPDTSPRQLSESPVERRPSTASTSASRDKDDINRLKRMMRETMESEKKMMTDLEMRAGGSPKVSVSRGSSNASNLSSLAFGHRSTGSISSNKRVSLTQGGEAASFEAVGLDGSLQFIAGPRRSRVMMESENPLAVIKRTIIVTKQPLPSPMSIIPENGSPVSPSSPAEMSEPATVLTAQRANRTPSLRKKLDADMKRRHKSNMSKDSVGSINSTGSGHSKRRSIQDRPPTPPMAASKRLSVELLGRTDIPVPIPPTPTLHKPSASKSLLSPIPASPASVNSRLSQRSMYSSYGESLYDHYFEDVDPDTPAIPSRRPSDAGLLESPMPPAMPPTPRSAKLPNNGAKVTGPHVEVLEMADGSVIWEVVNGLRDDDDRPQTGERPSTGTSGGNSTGTGKGNFKGLHVKTHSNLSHVSANGSSDYGGSVGDSLEEGDRLEFPTVDGNTLSLHWRHDSSNSAISARSGGSSTNVVFTTDEKVRRFMAGMAQRQQQ